MDLKWWPVAVAGLACLAATFALVMLLPMEQVRRRLRPLANTARLTGLPEYIRIARARTLSMIVTIALLVLLFGAAVLATARPTGWSWELGTSEPPTDIMLCVGEPVTQQSTGEFLSYFAQQTTTYGTQRIGLTSPNRRVVPMTRDYQYAAGKFGDLAQAANVPPGVSDRKVATFSPAVSYVDYAPSVEDILALCMTGFPSFEQKSTHRRSLIYLGPSAIRRPGESRPSLFTEQRVADMAATAGIQINVVTPTAPQNDTLRRIAESTGGQYFRIDPSGSDLSGHLDGIRDNPPEGELPGGATLSGWLGDSPTIPLAVAAVTTTLLCLSLMVLRR
ncbi:hypothetical protein [Mycobacterium sp.]|uniref:hypothetical protein n=1 Tax=Mycobacterium sp. TaxID=1785 RepID=UPI002D8A29B3|nr:hypothetical protein [Mycobacterium sp.]